jgi:hypothetical protein
VCPGITERVKRLKRFGLEDPKAPPPLFRSFIDEYRRMTQQEEGPQAQKDNK